MKDLRSSTSELAIIEYWNQRQRNRFPETVGIDWMERYFPTNLFYFRPLSHSERVASKYDGNDYEVWYGAFHPQQQSPVVVTDIISVLFAEARDNGMVLMYLQ